MSVARVSSISINYRVFSRDVTAAMLVSRNKGTGAMMVSRTNPPAIEFCSDANVLICSRESKHSIGMASHLCFVYYVFLLFLVSNFVIGHFTCNL